MYKIGLFIFALTLVGCSSVMPPAYRITCVSPKVPVVGYAQSLVGGHRIENASVRIVGKKLNMTTNRYGQFGFCGMPNKQLTLVLKKHSRSPFSNYKTTQTATVTIPPQGLTGKYAEMTFQVPRIVTYDLLKFIIKREEHIKSNSNGCIAVTTVTAYKKTLKDDIQGEESAKLILTKNGKVVKDFKPVYFGILLGKTDPFKTGLTSTSKDGGVLIYNLSPSKQLYALTATKPGKTFSTAYFRCTKRAFINLAPPHSPGVIK